MTIKISALNTMKLRENLTGDILGGFAAMLVALPSAIAFGLIIFAPLGGDAASKGALAGIIGAVVLGLLAPIFGGTSRLISAPCAPAAALLSIFALDAVSRGTIPIDMAPLYIAIVAFGAGFIQLLAGIAGGGTFIKYIPYPVVAGYLSGVGILIFLGQLPKFLGLPKGINLQQGIISVELWRWESILIGSVTILMMLLVPKILKAVPASIAALGSGIAVYFILAYFNTNLMTLDNNPLVVGNIKASVGDIVSVVGNNISSAASINFYSIKMLVVTIISLGVLLSIDTLKTCVVLDVLTGTRHNSNRELFGQGIANMAASVFGGVPGSGTMGGTLVNIYSGGRTRFSGIFEGVSALAVLLLIARYISWIPVASLAGVLLVVAVRMIDRKSFHLLKNRSTMFDFAVILAVIVSAVSLSLIAAAGVGIALAVILFLRNQIRFPVVRRRVFGNQIFSKKNRPVSEQKILEEKGNETLVVELQGQLFFGTTDQLYTQIEPFIGSCRYFILDMKRVLSIDFTAANMLTQLKSKITEKGGILIFSSVPLSVPTGQNVRAYLEQLGFEKSNEQVNFFQEMGDAVEWVEDEYIREFMPERLHGKALELSEFDFFKNFSRQTLETLSQYLVDKKLSNDNKIFNIGDKGGDIYFIKKGSVRIELPLANGTSHHLSTFSRGAFFGDMSFLDNQPRSADAIAVGNVELFILNREDFNKISQNFPDVTGIFFERLSVEISHRLRQNVIELKALEEN
jgi:SulP family sulfate permease